MTGEDYVTTCTVRVIQARGDVLVPEFRPNTHSREDESDCERCTGERRI